jgi:hypothetical protein
VFKANNLLVTYVNGKNVYVFDGTDGLLLFANDASLNEGIKAGDKITADFKGQLYLYNGLTEIATSAIENLTVNSSDNAVEAQKVTIADVNCIIGVILGDPDTYQGRADANDDGEVTIADINVVLSYIF